MKIFFYFLFFYIVMIFEAILACFVLCFIFSGLLIKKVYKFLMPKKAQEIFKDIVDDTYNFLGVEAKPHIEARNFTVANDGTPEFNEEIPETTT